MFPWLSGIAYGYETFAIVSLKFEYVSQAAFTNSGMIYAAIDYDSADTNMAISPAQIT